MVKRLAWVFIVISLVLHLASYWFSLVIEIPKSIREPSPQKVEIDLIEKAPEKTNTPTAPIRFAEAPKELVDDSLEALKKKADLLSEKVQRVKKEVRANVFGLTKNRQMGAPTKKVSNKQPEHPFQSAKDFDPANSRFKPEPSQAQNGSPLDLSPSTFGQQLPRDVQVGQFTALNTDRHLFYTFYARIEEVIRPPWEDRVVSESHRLNQQSPYRPKGGWTTRLDVILDPEGKLIKVVLLKSSGVNGFDQAAIDAFQKAGFFPHPPKGIINSDGVILLKYVFSVF